jgi:hypothetical protein
MRLTRGNLEDLLGVTAEMDSVVVIPLERSEEDRAIWRVVFADGHVIG